MTINSITTGCKEAWKYASEGVWQDTRHNLAVTSLKTINLAVRSFLDRDMQAHAAALTFKTLLATVPALALMLSVSRGFGLDNGLQSELLRYFPAQKDALDRAFDVVNVYLTSVSKGWFVGIGILFLLYTLISLLGSVEGVFNKVWGVRRGRTTGRMITDYTAILFLLPVLLLCSSGITVFMSSALQTMLPFEFINPMISSLIDFAGVVLLWLFFIGTYILVPNTRVKARSAILPGILAGTGCYIVQWLFVSGQIYVTRYNAIYGSFAFLPLLMLWMQMVWLITLAGAVLCYASQSVSRYNFDSHIKHISSSYRFKVLVAIMQVVTQRFTRGDLLPDESELASCLSLPPQLVAEAVNDLTDAGLINRVAVGRNSRGTQIQQALAPGVDPSQLTVGLMVCRLRHSGTSDFLKEFNDSTKALSTIVASIEEAAITEADRYLIKDLPPIHLG